MSAPSKGHSVKPSEALRSHRADIRRIVAQHRTRNPRVFGSVVNGKDTEISDLDLLVDPTPDTTLLDIAHIQCQLQRLLGVPVDVLRLLHELLGIRDDAALATHPRSGASWEGFAIEQILRIAAPDEAYFWATYAGAELDLLMIKDGRKVGVEIKRADARRLQPSMQIAMRNLKLDALYVVYPGARRYTIADGIEAVPLAVMASRETP